MAGRPEFRNVYAEGYSDLDGEGYEPLSHRCFLPKFVEWSPEEFATDVLSAYQLRQSDFLITELDEFELGALADPFRAAAGRASVLHRYKADVWTPNLRGPLILIRRTKGG